MSESPFIFVVLVEIPGERARTFGPFQGRSLAHDWIRTNPLAKYPNHAQVIRLFKGTQTFRKVSS